MKIFNPTTEAIAIQFNGVEYSAPANGYSEEMPEEAARYWKDMVHNFITIGEKPAAAVKEVPEVIKTPGTVAAPVEEAIKETAPAKKK